MTTLKAIIEQSEKNVETLSDGPLLLTVEGIIEARKALALEEQARVLSVIATSLENIDNTLRDCYR